MKVILLQDVANLGNKYDVKDVSNGYARNFLFPRKLGEVATEQKIKAIETRKKQAEQMREVDRNILKKNIEELNGVKISIEEKANEKGHLFAGVHKEEISRILKEQRHIDIPPELIELEHPIKEIGGYKIRVGDREFTLEILAKGKVKK